MKNVKISIEDKVLTIKGSLRKAFGLFPSGKNTIIATTKGNVSGPDREENKGVNILKK